MPSLFLRGVSGETAARLHKAAAARGMTLAQYLERLMRLQDVVRARAQAGDDGLQVELEALGLQLVES